MEILITLGVVVGVILTTAMVVALSMALYRYYWEVKYDIIQNKYYLKHNYDYDDD